SSSFVALLLLRARNHEQMLARPESVVWMHDAATVPRYGAGGTGRDTGYNATMCRITTLAEGTSRHAPSRYERVFGNEHSFGMCRMRNVREDHAAAAGLSHRAGLSAASGHFDAHAKGVSRSSHTA